MTLSYIWVGDDSQLLPHQTLAQYQYKQTTDILVFSNISWLAQKVD